ncbi:MAG: Crp/Fnr family transcriptional regulator [Gemmatimonadales bacterium]
MLTSDEFSRSALFAGLSAEARRELAARGIKRRFGAGEALFRAGDMARGLFVIVEGEVRVVRGADGRQHVVHVEGPGGTLGEVPLLDGGGYPATAIATRPTRCQIFSREALEAAIRVDPGTAFVLLQALSARVRLLVDRLDRLATRSVGSRLARLLLRRHADAQGGSFTLGTTQHAVAEELGTVREVVVRALRALRQAGVVSSAGRGRLRVSDLESLREIAGEESGSD